MKILPPLHETTSNMLRNYTNWGNRRKLTLMQENAANKEEEIRKVDNRVAIYTEKMGFLEELKTLPVRSKSFAMVSTGNDSNRDSARGENTTVNGRTSPRIK